MQSPFDFSVIICTYNPRPDIFGRLLRAIASFRKKDISFELIIVDNNSPRPVSAMKESLQELKELPAEWKIVLEKEPGLTSARLAGCREAKAGWLVFFDDDNEPAVDYLETLGRFIPLYPEVGCWGPGRIEVEYTDAHALENGTGDARMDKARTGDPWLEEQKPLFQQRRSNSLAFDGLPAWQSCYPYGTGMAIRKEIMEYYAEQVKGNVYTLSDRKGKSLASGGDVQIVLTGIKKGFKAGVIPFLEMRHLITGEKATLPYLEKQSFGTASCNLLAHEQVFPEHPFHNDLAGNRRIFRTAYGVFRIYFPKGGWKGFRLQLSRVMGEINARYVNAGAQPPLLLRWYERMIHV